MEQLTDNTQRLIAEIEKVIVGKRETIELARIRREAKAAAGAYVPPIGPPEVE